MYGTSFLIKAGWFVLYLVIFFYLLRYTFVYWIVLCVGLVTPVILAGYLVIRTNGKKHPTKPQFRHFLFINEWKNESSILQPDQDVLDQPILEESFLISETLDDLINMIIREFIDGWFHHVSSSPHFQQSIKIELKSVIVKIKDLLVKVDIPKLLVSRILPVLQDHFQNYVKAEEAVKLKSNISKIDSSDFHIAVAKQYDRGRLHAGVTLSTTDIPNIYEKKFLRSKIASILPLLLSENESHSDVSLSIVTEILACTVLTSIFSMVGEGDFYNLLIVKLIGDNMKHREQVKRLRAALEEHTQQVNHKASYNSLSIFRNEFEELGTRFTVTEDMSAGAFKDMLSSVSNINSLQEIGQIEKYIMFQLRNASKITKSENTKLVIKRLQLLKSTLINQKETISQGITTTQDLHLFDILNNVSALKCFSEYLSYQGRLDLLEFWKEVELIKAPLEDSIINEDGHADLSLSLEFSSVGDVIRIGQTFMNSPNLKMDQETIDMMNDLILNKGNSQTYVLFQKSRRALMKLQMDVYHELDTVDFQKFRDSTLFSKLVNIEKETFSQSPDTLMDSSLHMNDDVSPDVLQAVENAFTQIMNHPEDESSQTSNSRNDSTDDLHNNVLLTINMKKNLFGENSTLFGSELSDSYSNPNRHSKLFEDSSDESGTDSESVGFDTGSQLQDSLTLEEGSNSQVYLAAPGDLTLSEKIFKLTDDIDKLNEQMVILEPLLKKADLTNNISDLKVLRKSKLSLNREIDQKELQKQQYIVQENDNSLYGKSQVRIQSFISGNENGKEFILYIVEVQKFSSDDPKVVTAGWIVARRFSQFFKLNEYLKYRYHQVANIKFPKRTMLVLKFQQQQLVELRKAALEEYLQELIKIPDVCSDKAFRSFLSSENFNLRKNQPFDVKINVSGLKPKNNVEMVANRLYNSISSRLAPTPLTTTSPKTKYDEAELTEMMENLKDMQKELKLFDEPGNKGTFVKPICDLLIVVFRLNNSKSWLRGRALVVILQQMFGTTIEKKVNEQVNLQLKTEENILDILIMLKTTLFPNGKFKDPPVIRNLYQQSSTRQEAKVLLELFMSETCSKIFGTANTNYASRMAFGMIQNDYLNRHVLFEIFEEIINEVFGV